MHKTSYGGSFSGAAMISLLIFLVLVSTGPLQDANAQQNSGRDNGAAEKQSQSSKNSSQASRPYRNNNMEGYFDPESGELDVPHGTDLQVTDLIELTVRDEQGETIGEIEDVIMDGNDTLLAVIAREGFLGMGEDLVTVPVSELEMGENYTHVIYSTRRGNLEDRPSYKGGRAYHRPGTSKESGSSFESAPGYGYTPRWPYGQPYGYPRAYRYDTQDTPPEYRNRYDPYPYRWQNYTMYDELPSYDRYGEEGFQRPQGYWDRRTDSARQRRSVSRTQGFGGYYDPEPVDEHKKPSLREDPTPDFIGRPVENEQGIAIGTVDDLITNRKGEPVAVISVSGYTGEKRIGVRVSDLEMNDLSGSLRYGASRKEIRNQESISEKQ